MFSSDPPAGSSLQIRLFGPGRVDGSKKALPRPAFPLVAMLDLSAGRQLDREAIATRLWEDAPPSRAFANLRQLLGRINAWQSTTNHIVVEATRRFVSRPPNAIPSDLQMFLNIGEVRSTAALRFVDELYAGEFLADVAPRGPTIADWLEAERATLRDRYLHLALLGTRTVGGVLAHRVLVRLSEVAPYDDAVARQAMIAASSAGPGAVHAEYRRFADRLRRDLNSEPELATVNLLHELASPTLPARATGSVEPPTGIESVFAHVPKVLILPPASSGSLDPDAAVLVDMMIDDVIVGLARERTFAVFAPHTARQLVRTPFPAGNPYGAGYLVTTGIRPGPPPQLMVTLSSVTTHEILLAELVGVSSADLADRQSQIASSLAARLSGGIERSERRHTRATGSASAYVHFLLGSDAISVLDLRSLRRAKQHFRHAIQLSPEFVPARALLARTLCLEWILLDRNDMAPVREALMLAKEAVSIDSTNPLGHREVGHAMLYLDDLDAGVGALRSATGLGPHHADILMNYADGLVHLGNMGEARAVMDQALALNPLPPDQYHWISGTVYYMLGDYGTASASFKRMKEPEGAARFIAAVEAMNGNIEEAHRHRDIFLRNHPDFRLADYMVPQRRAEDRAHYLEGLRRAGFA
jgi:DNA-binding SARP family transcriptional activator/tetratricopeptide (TPR) repeat protein